MIENKRFVIASYPSDIEDTITGEKYPCSSYGTHMEIICDKLNELSEQADAVREELRLCKEENKEIKQLINIILFQIDVDKINTENARYSAGIIFTSKEFRKIQQIWKGDFE